MTTWLLLLLPSLLFGFLCARYLTHAWALYIAILVPWFSVLIAIVYSVYWTPYQGGGATMWPVAQFFAGGIAAAASVGCYVLTHKVLDRK